MPPDHAGKIKREIRKRVGWQLNPMRRIIVEVTNRCNHRCPVCQPHAPSISNQMTEGLMDWDIFLHVADEAARVRPEWISLYGHGEPLLHPRLADMVAALKERDLATEVVTNGDLLSVEILSALSQAGLRSLVVSDPHVTDDNYRRVRGIYPPVGRRERLKAVIDSLPSGGPDISIRSLVLARHTRLCDLESFVLDWFSSSAISQIGLHGYLPWPQLVIEEMLVMLRSGGAPCMHAQNKLMVCWNGVITPCSYDVFHKLKVGTIPETRLGDVFNGQQLRELRRNLSGASSRWPDMCRTCLLPRADSPYIHLMRTAIETMTMLQLRSYLRATLLQLQDKKRVT